MSHTTTKTPLVRYKFMPTPNNGLHVGHAWLLFVMKAIIDTLKQNGNKAELVLVVDEINMNYTLEAAKEEIRRNGESIIDEMRQLGVPPDIIVWNGEPRFFEALRDPAIQDITLEHWRPDWVNPARYYLHNAALDLRLGITHILRGNDLLRFARIYRECYHKLGSDCPFLGYLPFVRDSDGNKIGSHMEAYLIRNVLKKMPVENLYCLLVRQCVCDENTIRSLPDAATALRQLLSDQQWAGTRGSKRETGWKRFIKQFVDSPQIGMDQGKCVAVG